MELSSTRFCQSFNCTYAMIILLLFFNQEQKIVRTHNLSLRGTLQNIIDGEFEVIRRRIGENSLSSNSFNNLNARKSTPIVCTRLNDDKGYDNNASGDDANKTEEEKFSAGSKSDVYMRFKYIVQHNPVNIRWVDFPTSLINDWQLNEQKHSESSKTLLFVENEDHFVCGFNGSPPRPEDVQNERNVVLQLDSQDRQMATEDALESHWYC
ncbi:hypothetical protein LguiB_034858 [Lonicera macranthoides]